MEKTMSKIDNKRNEESLNGIKKEKNNFSEKTDTKTNKKFLKILEWCLPALAICVISFLVLAIKGVYPFGSGATGYIDYNVGMIPALTYVHDVLHGIAGTTVDWSLGGGTNAYISVAQIFFLPIDLLIGLFPRDSIAYTAIFIIIIKFCFMAETSYWIFKKTFKNVKVWFTDKIYLVKYDYEFFL